MKSGGAAGFVGGEYFLPTGFVWTDRFQIDPPELHFVVGQCERRLNLEGRILNVPWLIHVVPTGGVLRQPPPASAFSFKADQNHKEQNRMISPSGAGGLSISPTLPARQSLQFIADHS